MKWTDNHCNTVFDAVEKNTGMANSFLNPISIDSYIIYGLDLLANEILKYCKSNAVITIVGDYDADGVCAAAGLYLLLCNLCDYRNIRIRLPRRITEGYGLSPKIIDEISDGIVITVDNGIAARQAIQKAKEKGLVVFVIDHHEPIIKNGALDLPPADLIVDPHIQKRSAMLNGGSYPENYFWYYCGAGLVYKLARMILPPESEALKNISAFAAIATVADVVSLTGDNRNIYHEGIANIHTGHITPGLQCLIDLLNCDNKIAEQDIGFRIAPMLNAPGRLYDDGAMLSLQTVLAPDFRTARTLAGQLRDVNEIRKMVKEEAVERAKKMITEITNPIVICDPETPEGIVGLVAGFIVEEYNVSAIVFTKTEHGLKGSARAADYDDIKGSLDVFHDLHPEILSKYGGHTGAAGLSILEKDFDDFRNGMIQIMPEARPKPDSICYDISVPSYKAFDLAYEIEKFRPFGEGNPPVIVKITDFKPVPDGNEFYKTYNKGTVRFAGANCEAIAFSMADRLQDEGLPAQMDLVGTLGFRHFRQTESVQIEVMDFKKKEIKLHHTDVNQFIEDALKKLNLF